MPRKPMPAHADFHIELILSQASLARLKFSGRLTVTIDVVSDKLVTRIRMTKRQLIEAYNNKMSLREIAMLSGWSVETVRQKLRGIGLDTGVFPGSRQEVEVDESDTSLDDKPTGSHRRYYGKPVYGMDNFGQVF